MSYALFIPDVNKPPKAVLSFDTGWRISAVLDFVLSMELSETVFSNESGIVLGSMDAVQQSYGKTAACFYPLCAS